MKFKYFLILFFSIFLISGCSQPPQKTVIKFSSWGSQSEIAIIKPILSEFEKENPDIKVEFMHIAQNYFQKLHLLFASNLPPDVIFINNLYLPIYADAGMLEKLNNQFDEKLFNKKALEALIYQNNLYALPRDVSNLVFFINKDIFDTFNVPYPNKYWSFNDLLILAKKTTKDTNNDGKTNIWGVSFEEDLLFYLPYLMSHGGGVLSDDLKHLTIDSIQSQKALRFYADLRNKYNVAPKKSESASATMAQLFLQGKIAMHLSGRWLMPKYKQEAKFSWGVVNFPKGEKGSIVPLDASGWAIAKNSKHKDEALKLIRYLSSKTSIEKMTQSGLIVPARTDVLQGEFLSCKNSPYNAVFTEVIKTSKKTPVSVNYREIQDNLKEKTESLFNLP